MRFFRLTDAFVMFTLAAALPSAAFAQTKISDVCAGLDLLNRSVDRMMLAGKIRLPAEPMNHESGLRLEHVYQLHLACLEMLHDLEANARIGRIPPLVSSPPMFYQAQDVVALSQLMHKELKRPAWILWITKLPDEHAVLNDRTADDAFTEALRLFVRMNAITRQRHSTPDEAFAQLARAIVDAKAVLRHIDSAHRYRIDAPSKQEASVPADIFERCLALRGTLNQVAKDYGQKATPLPFQRPRTLSGEDVFVQTQIILAELNLLKLRAGTASATPLAVRVTGKTWTDVVNLALFLDYLIGQTNDLRQLVASEPSTQ